MKERITMMAIFNGKKKITPPYWQSSNE